MATVEIRVQHRAGRDAPLERLLANLPPAVVVVTDDEPVANPWRGYRKCLLDLPRKKTHLCILQDDTIVGRNFAPALKLIAKANLQTPVSLFLSKAPRRTYARAAHVYGRASYVDVHRQDLVHVVGLLWPVKRAADFVTWTDENPDRIRGTVFQSDDATVTRWMRLTSATIRCTLPSLVEHPDDVPSIVNSHRVRHGADSSRVAAFWIGDDDPLAIKW